jgi:hypothetical protein
MNLGNHIGQQVAKLPNRLQVAYAAACTEHVLPLFEHLRTSDIPRDALNLAWRYSCGGVAEQEALQKADRETSGVIPNIDEDQSAEAELSMASAVNVLETLDCIQDGSSDAAVRAASGAFNALCIALQMADPTVVDSIAGMDLNCTDHLPEVLREEWEAQKSALAYLSCVSTPAIAEDWIKSHRERGLKVLYWWKSARK